MIAPGRLGESAWSVVRISGFRGEECRDGTARPSRRVALP